MENNNSPFIEITDLVKKFGTFTALNGVSLNVLPGLRRLLQNLTLLRLLVERTKSSRSTRRPNLSLMTVRVASLGL